MELANQLRTNDPNETKPPVWEDLGYANFE